MKLKNNLNLGLHNKFELQLIGPDGNVKQTAYAYNVVTNGFWELVDYSATSTQYVWPFDTIAIGTGTGTPASTDISLFTELTRVTIGNNRIITKDYPTASCVFTVTFPASETLTGVLTEVGILGHRSWVGDHYPLDTHALLQDAEGNPITINKTSLDQLVVTATVYMTVTTDNSISLVPASEFTFFNMFNNGTYGFPSQCIISATGYTSNSIYSYNANDLRIPDKTISWATVRIPTNSTINNCFVNSLYVPGVCYVNFPLTDVPAYNTVDTLIGTGDGVLQDFNSPIPVFTPDSDVIKIDGVTLTRNIDYTIDPTGNTLKNVSASACARAKNKKANPVTPTTMPSVFATPNSAGVLTMKADASPLFFDMGEAVPINILHLTSVSKYDSGITCHFKLEYSYDNTSWVTVVETESQALTATAVPVTGGPDFSFTEITARYWQFSIITSDVTSRYGVNFAATLTDAPMFGHVGNKIHFNTAPAVDSILTIAAEVDRPWKTVDYIIDFSLTISF